jgi:hypothetical protein
LGLFPKEKELAALKQLFLLHGNNPNFLHAPPLNAGTYELPKYKNIIPIRISNKSIALLFKFFSLNTIAPKRKETITLPRRTIETMEIMASSRLKA